MIMFCILDQYRIEYYSKNAVIHFQNEKCKYEGKWDYEQFGNDKKTA